MMMMMSSVLWEMVQTGSCVTASSFVIGNITVQWQMMSAMAKPQTHAYCFMLTGQTNYKQTIYATFKPP
jgi:putative sterol carrier protein